MCAILRDTPGSMPEWKVRDAPVNLTCAMPMNNAASPQGAATLSKASTFPGQIALLAMMCAEADFSKLVTVIQSSGMSTSMPPLLSSACVAARANPIDI
ncbi:hypothetical protein FGIG_10025 [Fasciola gigantica]|uniref:Uncharacterized protein n=1 Tax=Fasciola gigantica TaxID=46835 RepID=A0A504YT04_FASGI|nr:hypothetical protein FGIG_10025 [Fasciola gigantica]